MEITDLATGFTRTEAAAKLGTDVTPHMVSMWALRGWVAADGTRHKLRVVGVNERGERLYRFGDLLAAEAATRAKTHRSHRSRALATEAA